MAAKTELETSTVSLQKSKDLDSLQNEGGLTAGPGLCDREIVEVAVHMLRSSVVIFILGLAAFGLQACGLRPEPQESCNFVQNGDQQRVSWGAQTPVLLYIHEDSVHRDYYEAMKSAAEVWNKSVGRDVLKIAGVTRKGPSNVPDGVNLISFQRDWDGDPLEQARTTIWWAGEKIYEADIKINERFKFFGGNTPEADKIDMQSLMIHEFGHVLGLKHVDVPPSVMVPTLASASSSRPESGFRRKLSEIDKKSVGCEY